MSAVKPVHLDHVLTLYETSTLEVRALEAKLPESELEGIVHEVLSRLKAQALQNLVSIDDPARAKVERLCYALISDDHEEGQRFIENVYDAGATLEAIYLSYLAEAAHILGEWWENDDASFYEVSIGTSRIYAIMRGLSHLFTPTRPVEVKSAVFASIPGETHNLGIRMAADLFGREGWDIDLIVGKDHDDLVSEIVASHCNIIGLSAGGAHSVAALARLVVALRISKPRATIVLSGQIANEAKDAVDALGLDGVVTDIPSAIALFESIWDRETAH